MTQSLLKLRGLPGYTLDSVGMFVYTGALSGLAWLSSCAVLDFILTSARVFVVKLDGVCSDKNQGVCLKKERGENISAVLLATCC